MNKFFYIATLGCKVNQYESDGIASELSAEGWQQSTTADKASVCIINTCTVTSKAAMQSRQQIRSIIKANPTAKIIVTGCHAETEPDKIEKIESVDMVIGHKAKFKLVNDLIESVNQRDDGKTDNGKTTEEKHFTPFFKPAVTGSKTRAYLKIQDGCNAFCAYCIVPYARGRSRSMPQNEVIEHLKTLSSKGYKEAILTGIHVGAYGLDLEKKSLDTKLSIKNKTSDDNLSVVNESPLTELLIEISRLRPIHRVRLSSIEPKELTDKIVDLASTIYSYQKNDSNKEQSNQDKSTQNIDLTSEPSKPLTPCLCDHFHIPLQSGDDIILKRMGRPYNSALFTNLINRIHNQIPNAAIGVDILEGFPGETNEAFENTINIIKKLPVSYLHVFPFSPRKGTPAYDYPDKVNDSIIKERCAIIRQIGFEKRRFFEDTQIEQSGKKANYLESVIQDKRDEATGKLIAITSNYLSVLLEGGDDLKRQIVLIELIGRQKSNKLIGRIAT